MTADSSTWAGIGIGQSDVDRLVEMQRPFAKALCFFS
jgi:hypothetical protein